MSLIHNTQFNAAIALFIVANLLQISLSVSPSSCIADLKCLKFETFFTSFPSKTRSRADLEGSQGGFGGLVILKVLGKDECSVTNGPVFYQTVWF